MFLILFTEKHFVSATNVSQFAQPKKHHEQQCVCNNVSSFARALTISSQPRKQVVLVLISFSLFTVILTNCANYNNGKKRKKEQRKSSYMCTRYYFEIVRSGQKSRAFEMATTTVQLIVRGGYLQNIREVITN